MNENEENFNEGDPLRWRAIAVEALQHGSEDFLWDAQIAAEHAKRITITPREMALAIRMRRLDKALLRRWDPLSTSKPAAPNTPTSNLGTAGSP